MVSRPGPKRRLIAPIAALLEPPPPGSVSMDCCNPLGRLEKPPMLNAHDNTMMRSDFTNISADQHSKREIVAADPIHTTTNWPRKCRSMPIHLLMAISPAGHPPLWAKLNRDTDGRVAAWHSLLDHSADVAAVLEELLGVPIIAERLGRLAGQPLDAVLVARLAALAFLHDVGKANRGFRARWQAGVKGSGHIRELHWLLNDDTAVHLRDRLWDALGLRQWESWFSEDAWPLWDTVFAHHGRPWHRTMPGRAAPLWGPGADGDPIGDLVVIGGAMPRWFPDAFRLGQTLPAAPNFHHAFAGLLMLSDWLGSDQAFFPFANGRSQDRMVFARPRAREALAAVGLFVAPVRTRLAKAALDFARSFDVPAPRRVQAIAPCPEACCVVLEAELAPARPRRRCGDSCICSETARSTVCISRCPPAWRPAMECFTGSSDLRPRLWRRSPGRGARGARTANGRPCTRPPAARVRLRVGRRA